MQVFFNIVLKGLDDLKKTFNLFSASLNSARSLSAFFPLGKFCSVAIFLIKCLASLSKMNYQDL